MEAPARSCGCHSSGRGCSRISRQMERRTQSEPIDQSLSEKYAEWIGWARSKADQIDPLMRPLTELQLEPEASRASTSWR